VSAANAPFRGEVAPIETAARAGTASLTLVRGGLTAFTRNGSLASLGDVSCRSD
jgi:hypothetical protein